MNENEVKPEPQVVGEAVISETSPYAGPINIVDTAEDKAAKMKVAKLQYKLIIEQARLAKRQTPNIARKQNILNRINSLRKKLDMRTLTLAEFNQGIR